MGSRSLPTFTCVCVALALSKSKVFSGHWLPGRVSGCFLASLTIILAASGFRGRRVGWFFRRINLYKLHHRTAILVPTALLSHVGPVFPRGCFEIGLWLSFLLVLASGITLKGLDVMRSRRQSRHGRRLELALRELRGRAHRLVIRSAAELCDSRLVKDLESIDTFLERTIPHVIHRFRNPPSTEPSLLPGRRSPWI